MEKKLFTRVIAPEGEFNLVKGGKTYLAYDVKESKRNNHHRFSFYIKVKGERHFCLSENCAHLNGGNWIIKDLKED